MKFARDVLITFGARALTIAIGLVSGIVIARMFGPEGKGIFAYIGFFVSMVMLVGNLGIANASAYFLRKDTSLIKSISGNALWIAGGIGMALAFLASIILRIDAGILLGDIPSPYGVILLPLIPFLLLFLFFQNIFLAAGRIVAYNFVPVVITAFQVTALLVLALLFDAQFFIIILWWVGIYIVGILYFPFVLLISGKLGLSFSRGLISKMMGYGFRGYVASLLGFLIVKADIYMVNRMLDIKALGLYSIASNVADYIFMFPAALGTIMFLRVVDLDAQAKVFTAQMLRLMALFAVVVSAVLYFFAEPLVVFVFGESFREAVPAVLLLLPGIVLFSLSIVLMNHFAGRGMPMIVIWSPLAALTGNIVMNLFLIPSYGIAGAAVASSVAYGAMLAINLVYFTRSERYSVREVFTLQSSDFRWITNGKKIFYAR